MMLWDKILIEATLDAYTVLRSPGVFSYPPEDDLIA